MSEDPARVEGSSPARAGEAARALIRRTRQVTRRKFPAEEKIRIVLEGIRGEVAVSELCRREASPTASKSPRARNCCCCDPLPQTLFLPLPLSSPKSAPVCGSPIPLAMVALRSAVASLQKGAASDGSLPAATSNSG